MYIIILKNYIKTYVVDCAFSPVHSMVYKVKTSEVQHFFGNVPDLLSSLFHGIPVYSTPNF